MKMRVKRNEAKSDIKLDLKEFYMYLCFIFMFLILLELLQTQQATSWHIFTTRAAPHFHSGGGFCLFPDSQHLSMNEKQRKGVFKHFP